MKLNAEGYISIDSHRKASVRSISYKELEDIFMVMGDLDALAVSQAVDHINPECIQEIEELVTEMEDICESSFVERFLEITRHSCCQFGARVSYAFPNL